LDCFEKWWEDCYYTLVPLWWKDESVIKASCLEARGFFIVVVLFSVLLPRIGTFGRTTHLIVPNGKPFGIERASRSI
jgi:hypothetical protein